MSKFGPDWFVRGGPKPPTKEVPFDEPEDEESEEDAGTAFCFDCGYKGDKSEFAGGECPCCESPNVSVDDDDDEPDGEADDDEVEEDDFGNTGRKLYSVKIEFTQERSGEAEVEIAADSEDQAKERIRKILEEDEYSILEDVDFVVDNQESKIVGVA